MDFHRLRLDQTGLLLPRAMTQGEQLSILTNLKGNRARILEKTPDPWKPPLGALLDQGDALILDFTQDVDLAVDASTPVPEALKALAPEADLRRKDKVNLLVDTFVRDLEAITHVFYSRPRDTENHRAGDRLYRRWFLNGTDFLRESHREQWAAVERLFGNPSEQTLADVAQLRISSQHKELLLVNDWFARLQGINPNQDPDTIDQPPTQAQPSPAEQAAELIHRLVGLATAIWPARTGEHADARALLVGAYLNVLHERSLR